MEEESLNYMPRLDIPYAAVRWEDRRDQVVVDAKLLDKDLDAILNGGAIWIKAFGWGMILLALMISFMVMMLNKQKGHEIKQRIVSRNNKDEREFPDAE